MDHGRSQLRMTHHTNVTEKNTWLRRTKVLSAPCMLPNPLSTSTCVCFPAHQKRSLNDSTRVSRVARLKPLGNGGTTILHGQQLLSGVHHRSICVSPAINGRDTSSHPSKRTSLDRWICTESEKIGAKSERLLHTAMDLFAPCKLRCSMGVREHAPQRTLMTVVSALRWNRMTTNGVDRADGASRPTVAVVHGPRIERALQATRLRISLRDRTHHQNFQVVSVCERHSLMDMSSLPERRLVELSARQKTLSLCALMVQLHSPDWISQILMDMSVPPEKMLVELTARQLIRWLCALMERLHSPDWTSQILMELSLLPEKRLVELSARQRTQSLCALMVQLHSPDWLSHSLMELSLLPEKRLVELSARQRTQSLCALMVQLHSPDWTSHSLIEVSSLPEKRLVELRARQRTQSLCASKVRLHSPDWISDSLIDLSALPEKRLVELRARQRTQSLCPTRFRTHRNVVESSVSGPMKKPNSASSSRPRPARKSVVASCVSRHKRTTDAHDRCTSSSLMLVTKQSGLLSSAFASGDDLFIHLLSSSATEVAEWMYHATQRVAFEAGFSPCGVQRCILSQASNCVQNLER